MSSSLALESVVVSEEEVVDDVSEELEVDELELELVVLEMTVLDREGEAQLSSEEDSSSRVSDSNDEDIDNDDDDDGSASDDRNDEDEGVSEDSESDSDSMADSSEVKTDSRDRSCSVSELCGSDSSELGTKFSVSELRLVVSVRVSRDENGSDGSGEDSSKCGSDREVKTEGSDMISDNSSEVEVWNSEDEVVGTRSDRSVVDGSVVRDCRDIWDVCRAASDD